MVDKIDPRELRDKARAARQLASEMDDGMAVKNLLAYADTLEERAKEVEGTATLPPAATIPSGEPPIAHAAAALKPEAASESEPESKDQ